MKTTVSLLLLFCSALGCSSSSRGVLSSPALLSVFLVSKPGHRFSVEKDLPDRLKVRRHQGKLVFEPTLQKENVLMEMKIVCLRGSSSQKLFFHSYFWLKPEIGFHELLPEEHFPKTTSLLCEFQGVIKRASGDEQVFYFRTRVST